MLSRMKRGICCLGVVLRDLLCGRLMPARSSAGRKGAAASPRTAESRRTGGGQAIRLAAAEERSKRPDLFPAGDWRKDVLDDFATWLHEIDTMEEASAVSPPSPVFTQDLFSVLTELSGLRQELKRQNREQGRLSDGLGQMEEVYREALARLDARTDDLVALRQDVQWETEKSVFLLFADLRDALERGRDAVRKASGEQGIFRRLPPAWEAVEEGYEMALGRFDRAMANLGIQRVLTVGQAFDSKFMVAVATRREPGMEESIVLEEILSGYSRGEEVLRSAQVVVAATDSTEHSAETE